MSLLPTVGLNAAVQSAGSASSLFGSLAGLSNPISTGLGLLQGVGGLFGGSDSEVSSAAVYSGLGNYSPTNTSSYRQAWIDLENPVHILVVGGLIIGGLYAYKRFIK